MRKMNNKEKEGSRSLDLLLTEVRGLLNSYLTLFPDERDKLKYLSGQLKNSSNLFDRKNFDGHITTSGIVIDSRKKVLLIHHKGLDCWLQPGGHYEEESEFWKTALREIKEETHLEHLNLHLWHLEKGIPLDIDTHHIPTNANKNEEAHYHHDFRYVFQIGKSFNISTLQLDNSEVSSFGWFNLKEAKELAPRLPLRKLIKFVL